MDGYKEAEKIEVLIKEVAKDNPVTHKNAIGWLRFTRTLQSRLEIFKAKALGILKEGDNK